MTDIADTIDTPDSPDDSLDTLRAQVHSQQQRIEELESHLRPESSDSDSPTGGNLALSAQAPRATQGTSLGAQRSRAADQARTTGRRNDILAYMRLRRA